MSGLTTREGGARREDEYCSVRKEGRDRRDREKVLYSSSGEEKQQRGRTGEQGTDRTGDSKPRRFSWGRIFVSRLRYLEAYTHTLMQDATFFSR